jgi:hypothetical protein
MAEARFALLVVLVACGGGSAGGPSGDDAGGSPADASVGTDAGDGDDDDDAGDVPLVFCEEPTTLLYDPPASRDTIPDDVFTRDDPSTVTGLRVSFASAQDAPDAVAVLWYEDAETLDGWGITAPLVLRFSDRLDPDSLPASPRTQPSWSDPVLLVELGAEMPPSPQVLIQMVENDTTVPNTSNTLYARSVGVPHLGEVIFPIDLVDLEPALPTAGNVAPTITGGSFQYDQVYVDDGPETERASHTNLSRNPVALEQTVHFLRTFEDTGTAEILDPYETLGIAR